VIGSAWAEHDKLKITEGQLKTWHESIDQSYLVKINRSVLKILHNAIYPSGKANTKAKTKGCSTSLIPQRFAKCYRARIMETSMNGKTPCGKFPPSKFGASFCSNSRASRIRSTVNSSTTWPAFYTTLPRVAKLRRRREDCNHGIDRLQEFKAVVGGVYYIHVCKR